MLQRRSKWALFGKSGKFRAFLIKNILKNSQSPQQYEKHHTNHTIDTVKYKTSTETYRTRTVI
jgi:hypothetical protein